MSALAELARTGAGQFLRMNTRTPSPSRTDNDYASIDKLRIDRKESSLPPIRRSVHFDDDRTCGIFPERQQYRPRAFGNPRGPTYRQSPEEELKNAAADLIRLSNESIPSLPQTRENRSHAVYSLPKTSSTSSVHKLTPIPVVRMENHGMVRSESPGSRRSLDPAIISTAGSESPRSLRDYHKGSGTLTGGGVQEIYVRTKPDMKKYKSKLDARLGQCIFVCFLSIAVILCIYGVIHRPVHNHLETYINRTHQIAKELKLAMDENYPTENNTDRVDSKGRRWMTVEELEDYADLTQSTNSTVWTLFWWNVFFCVLLAPVLILIHCEIVGGNVAKLVYRGVLIVCLLFAIAQFLYLLHPVLWGAAQFPKMIDRLFVEANPRDEYQLNTIQDDFVCTFQDLHPIVIQFDLQTPCLPKIKNSLFPTYSVLLLILIDLFPFLFAGFIYAWDACLKNNKVFKSARTRIELNNSRRVPFPKTNTYSPPPRNATITEDELPGKLV